MHGPHAQPLSRLLVGPAIALGAAAGSAQAIVVDLGSFELAGGEEVSVSEVMLPPVTGVMISFDYDEEMPDSSWASDVRVDLVGPDGFSFAVGGFSDPAPQMWSFDGPPSDEPGSYGETFLFDPIGPGSWSIVFRNDWLDDPNPNQYSNVLFEFIPGPATMAVLGIVLGRAAARRRRRDPPRGVGGFTGGLTHRPRMV